MVARRGLFLDLDGTLANTVTLLQDVYGLFLAGLGIVGGQADFSAFNGLPLDRIVRVLKDRYNLAGTVSELQATYVSLLAERHRFAPPSVGAQLVLECANDAGWAVAIVTSCPNALARDWLKFNGLSRYISAIVGGDDVAHGKPTPEPYLLALSSTGCPVGESIAVEDSRHGAVAAAAANLRTAVLASPNDREGWPAGVTFIERVADLIPMIEARPSRDAHPL